MARIAFRHRSQTPEVLHGTDPAVEALKDRLRSLDQVCITGLQTSLAAVASGDLT